MSEIPTPEKGIWNVDKLPSENEGYEIESNGSRNDKRDLSAFFDSEITNVAAIIRLFMSNLRYREFESGREN
jgi:hypothetical protein